MASPGLSTLAEPLETEQAVYYDSISTFRNERANQRGRPAILEAPAIS